jgi:CelD/BcsL family acetyltransferase involved in cellulose biosynthesis
MALDIRTITSPGALGDLRGEWIALLERTQCDLPFLTPEWSECWWETFQQKGRFICDSLRVKVVRDESASLVAIVPLMLTERPCFGPLRARTLGFLGVDQFITELQGPIVDPARAGDVGRALGAHLLNLKAWDWIAWQGMDRTSDLAHALEGAIRVRWGTAETGNVLELAPTWEELRGRLKRNIKESLRHCANSLRRDGLSARLVVAETPEDIRSELPTFFQLHSLRAGQRGTVVHRDRFASDSARDFLRTVCARLAERGVARVLTLKVGDAAVACRIAFRMHGTLYLYYSGVDPAWRRYSVATTLVAEAIKYAIATGLGRVHLSMGADVSKARWSPETPLRYHAVSVRPRRKSRAALTLYTWARESALLEGGIGRLLSKRQFDVRE